MQTDQAFQKRLLATFRIEAGEHLQALSAGLIELEKSADPAQQVSIIEAVFREAHSLKGAARAVGVIRIESICQALEGAFSALKSKQADVSPALLDVLHEAVDALGKSLGSAGVEGSGNTPSSYPELPRRLELALQTSRVTEAGHPVPTEPAAGSDSRPDRQRAPEDRPVLADTVRLATARLDALLFRAEGLLAAKLTSAERATQMKDASDALIDLKKEHAKAASALKGVHQLLYKAPPGNLPDRADGPLLKLVESMAWQSDLLKGIEARLVMLTTGTAHDHRSIGSLVDGLLEDVKKALMLPVSSVLEIFPKLVRDLSRTQGKDVEVAIQGGDIEIDRRILQAMRDPLIHLVRNCVDHGLETPEVRTSKGKSPRGKIILAATRSGGSKIEIRVADDGAGIDAARVEQAARRLGVGLADESQEQSFLQLIYQSGVSTSPMITDISGRGLGLAIVREKVERLGGTISVDTAVDQGTEFRIVLPLTLATFRGVQVRVNGQPFVIPTTYVDRVMRFRADAIKTVENRETVRWNEQALALVPLADVLELPAPASDVSPEGKVQAVVLSAGDKRLAISVDEIVDEREVLVKPLGKQLTRVRNIAGAAVLGTGTVVPVLDVPDLLKSALKASRGTSARRDAQVARQPVSKSILVAEDSITSRTLLKSILESAGYRVATAVDGADAFSLLRTQSYDLVVSDVEMPRMSGFELTARIRADKTLAEVPVVLVTALESREHRERGIDAGANAYIVKSSFDQSNLLNAIQRLI